MRVILLVILTVQTVRSGLVTAAQQQRPSQAQTSDPAEPIKNACDFLSKEEAESILGQQVERRANYPKQCEYVEVGFTNKPPKNKLVSLGASTSSTPQPNEYVESRKNAAPFQQVKEVPEVGDAALWFWIPGKTIDETPWPVSNWSEKDKAAANATFTKAINASSPPEKRPTEGLDSTPKIDLNPKLDEECGKADPSWRDFWSAEFVRQGWVKPEQGVTLTHFVNCQWVQYLGMDGYYHLADTINLYEPNVVFELNGKFFRKRSALFSTHRMMTTMGDRLAEAQQGFIPRSIMQFSTDLTLGKRTVPKF